MTCTSPAVCSGCVAILGDADSLGGVVDQGCVSSALRLRTQTFGFATDVKVGLLAAVVQASAGRCIRLVDHG